jgi:hypothetical protein
VVGNTRQRACLLCGDLLQSKRSAQNAKSDEHIIPAWLQKHLGIVGDPVTPVRVRTEDRRIIDGRRHVIGAFKAGTVCYDCNHGWMASLEVEAKPILCHLIARTQQFETLSENDRLIVARWTLKTAAVLNRCSTYGNPADEEAHPVPDRHMRILASGIVPPDVLVLGAGYQSNKAFDFLQFGTWTSPVNSIPLRQQDLDATYKIALSFRDLVLPVRGLRLRNQLALLYSALDRDSQGDSD